MLTIGISKLKCLCIIGVHSEERQVPQEILISLKVKPLKSLIAVSDRLDETLDYVLFESECRRIAVEGQFQLIETLAAAILDAFFTQFELQWAWIRIEKPQAIPSASCCFVEVERG